MPPARDVTLPRAPRGNEGPRYSVRYPLARLRGGLSGTARPSLGALRRTLETLGTSRKVVALRNIFARLQPPSPPRRCFPTKPPKLHPFANYRLAIGQLRPACAGVPQASRKTALKPRLSVVLPIFNAQATIGSLLSEMLEVLAGATP